MDDDQPTKKVFRPKVVVVVGGDIEPPAAAEPNVSASQQSLNPRSPDPVNFSQFTDYRFLPSRNPTASIAWTDRSKDDLALPTWTGMCSAIKAPYIPPSMKAKYHYKRKLTTPSSASSSANNNQTSPDLQPTKVTRFLDPSMLFPYFNRNRIPSPTLEDVLVHSPPRTVGITREPVPIEANTYETILGNELMGCDVEVNENLSPDTGILQNPESVLNQSHTPILDYSSPLTKRGEKRSSSSSIGSSLDNELRSDLEGIGHFGITKSSRNLMDATSDKNRSRRTVQKTPFKVLDAPDLMDDFYLSLVDWSQDNLLAVGLKQRVYLWNAATSAVTKLEELVNDSVTSLNWSKYQCGGNAKYLAVGTRNGSLQIWDVEAKKKITQYDDPNRNSNASRVGVIAWNQWLVCSGSRDRHITIYDFRCRDYCMETAALARSRRCRLKGSYVDLKGHVQEVCGLRWCPDQDMLASGGNDNRVIIRSIRQLKEPVHTLCGHVAAVKAMDWSPHKHGLLATGGGTADRTIRFWNCITGSIIHSVDTGSQVCNIAWSDHANEFVSTHGYSQNEIILWKYPTLRQLTRFNGHSFRVLYLAKSPDGRSIVTGAGDETLRFWHIFGGVRDDNPRPIVPALSDCPSSARDYLINNNNNQNKQGRIALISPIRQFTKNKVTVVRDYLHHEGLTPSR